MVQSPAGSGKSVTMAEIAKSATSKGNHVLFVVHRRELVQQIKTTFKSQGVDMNLCDVGMVQTVTRRLNKTTKPALILVDEAHHSMARTYQRIFDYFPDANVVGFTATPCRLSGEGFTSVFNDLVLGPKIKWLIDNNYLAPYRYFSIDLIDHRRLKKSSMGDYTKKSIEDAMGGSRAVIYGSAINAYKKYAENKKTIIYAFSVEFSKIIAEHFTKNGYPAREVDGSTPKEERQQAMADFRSGKIKILVNADLYGEGVDVPDCECVIMLRPTQSLSLFIQQSMRCMRYKAGKTAVILDLVANYKTHGLPDDDREWTLKGTKKKAHKPNDAPPIRTCKSCFAVFSSKLNICPICGQPYELPKREVQVVETDHLEEIKKSPVHIDTILTKKVSELKTYKELKDYAKAKGYKPGWVYFQAKLKGIFK